jgi:serine/threonine-protein kinase
LRGKYRIDDVLGVGGMAVVYAATHRNKKRFAIKMLHPELSRHDDVRTRFLREGYVANSVEHPGAVSVLDDDVAEDGAAFVVMELLRGKSVDQAWVEHDKKVPLALALSIGDALLDVLAAAHAKSVVHRDIKPANLFLTTDGRLMVLDFGIARIREEGSGAVTTQTGAMLGTPAFMSPEQALADTGKIDSRTDVWAAGATLFTLLTGEHVHEGGNAPQLLVNAATKTARAIASVLSTVPGPVAAVIDKALAFEKEDRWTSAKEMRDALARACTEATGAPIAPLPKVESVSGLEDTIASVDESAKSGGTAFDPTVDASAGEAAKQTGAGTSASVDMPRRPRRWITIGGVIAAVSLVATAIAFSMHGGDPASTKANSSASASTVASASPKPGRPPANPAAAAAFEAANTAFRNGQFQEANRNYEVAIAADPTLAAAYLRVAISWTGLDEMRGRDAFRKAMLHRTNLSDIDDAIADAYEPRFQDPPDRKERTRRLDLAEKRFPGDPYLETLLGGTMVGNKREPEADAAFARALAADPHWVPAYDARINELLGQGDLAHADALVEKCLEAVPAAVVCLKHRVDREDEDGRCEDMKADARRLLGLDAKSEGGHVALAAALDALGAPPDAFAEAMRGMAVDENDGGGKALATWIDAQQGELHGDLGAAERGLKDVLAWFLDQGRHRERDFAEPLIDVAIEMGDLETARAQTKALRARLAARGDDDDLERWGTLAAREVQLGLATRAQLHDEQKRALGLYSEFDRRREGERSSMENWRWVYANGVESEDDAKDALTFMPEMTDAGWRALSGGDAALDVGKVLALGGRSAEAVPLLERATRQCTILGRTVERVRAFYWLGLAREGTGDVAGARAAYEKLLARWGNAKPKSITADKARARLARLR